MRIKNLTKSDSAEYKCYNSYTEWSYSHFPGVMLVVTGLEVVVTPSAVVTEDKRVTLTCSSSCPLTDNTYIWYCNGQPLTLTEGQHKQLVLDPVSAQHAGKYSCAVRSHQNIKSPEETLTVRGPSWTLAAAAGIAAALLLVILLSIFLWIRRKRTSTQTPRPEAQEDTEQLNHPPVHSSISAVGQEPIRAAQSKPAEQDEHHYSSLHFSKKNPLYSIDQPPQPQPQPEEEVQYAAVNICSADIAPRFTVSTGDEYCTVHKKTKNNK
ncbi:sialoadhesin-like [Myripristis murdjan]|uniref:sialoadhesin-like n=1 Tax=Myripristis murdjan TaxID=586833 RepID=UPI0011761F48|nr:sialoadhesin-like [Myripristis murdjan]